MTPPVLFLLFNRPDLAEHVFARIREAEPTQLFIAVDGPRRDRNDESELVAQNQAFAGLVDWDCEVKTLFRDENLGCGRAVSEAITWFFEHVEAGIILEDDCVPDLSFFPFTAELLSRYADDESVMFIGGSNFQDGETFGDESYYFSKYAHVWGWATWARAWRHYSFELRSWRELETKSKVLSCFNDAPELALDWGKRFDRVSAGKIDTWDYQWCFAIWERDGLTIVPQKNLVMNIGFDIRATHTTDDFRQDSGRSVGALSFPLVHPTLLSRNWLADSNYERLESSKRVSFIQRLWSWLKRKQFVKFVD